MLCILKLEILITCSQVWLTWMGRGEPKLPHKYEDEFIKNQWKQVVPKYISSFISHCALHHYASSLLSDLLLYKFTEVFYVFMQNIVASVQCTSLPPIFKKKKLSFFKT